MLIFVYFSLFCWLASKLALVKCHSSKKKRIEESISYFATLFMFYDQDQFFYKQSINKNII